MVVGVLGVVTSCVLCARVSRVLKDVFKTGCISCATENTYITARLEARSKLSVVTILSHSSPFLPICFCLWSAVSQSVLCHANVDLFLFSEDESISNAVASILGHHCALRDYVSHVVGCVVSIVDCFQSANFSRTGPSQRGRLCFRMKRR